MAEPSLSHWRGIPSSSTPATKRARTGALPVEDTASTGRIWTRTSALKDSCEGRLPPETLGASKPTESKRVMVELRADADLRSGSRSHRLIAGAATREAGAHGLVRRPRPRAGPAFPGQAKHSTHSRSECAQPVGGSSRSPGLPFNRQCLGIGL